ncbi:hypothetical protein CHLRE_03g144344v5 [Chlamydomonas reinhardtii]|nr:uncharacterized protein CHLRE_03g144344v5 [Chlamydomonas reinhardtii]PNW84408.1 hypothetical protein CHLRE_03g144344v5 [Chlamydomonas reinhardtii]
MYITYSSGDTGHMHGGYRALAQNGAQQNSPGYTFPPAPAPLHRTITAVRACCIDAPQFVSGNGNGVQRLHFRTANGTVIAIGATGGDPCAQPQPWVDVPAGYELAGLRSLVPAPYSDTVFLHRIGFVFGGLPSSPPSPPPSPPSQPSPPVAPPGSPTPASPVPPMPPKPAVTTSSFQCGSGVADYYVVTRDSDVPYIEAGGALIGLQGLGQRTYMSRLQPLYRGDLSAPAHGLRYQISPIDFALMNMYSDFPDVDLLAAWSLSSPQRVVAVSACCSSGKLNIYTNMVARLLFRRANGDVFSLGAAGSNECQRPQGWIDVPQGSLLAGFVTDTFSDYASYGALNPTVVIDRIAFVFATPLPGQWTQPDPPPPSTPSPPMKLTRQSRFFCGSTFDSPATSPGNLNPGAPNNPYVPALGALVESDDDVAALGYPLTAITFSVLQSFGAMNQARSMYGSVPGRWHKAPGFDVGSDYGADLTTSWGAMSPERVVAVSACCSASGMSGQAMTPIKVVLRTASNRTIAIGYDSSGRLTAYPPSGDPCYSFVPQPFEPVPPGFLLGGLATESVIGGGGPGFDRLAYVFVQAPPPRPEDYVPPPPAPPPPPSPPPPSPYGAFYRSSSGDGSGGSSMAIGIGVAVGGVALVGLAALTFLGLRRRARQRYGSDVAFDGATCGFYPAFMPPSPPPPPPRPHQQSTPFATRSPPLQAPYQQQASAAAAQPLLPNAVSSGRRQLSISQSVALQIQLLMGGGGGGGDGVAGAAVGTRHPAAGEPWHLQDSGAAAAEGAAAGGSAEAVVESFSASALHAATAGFGDSHLLADLSSDGGGAVYRGSCPQQPSQQDPGCGGGVASATGSSTCGGGGGRDVAVWRQTAGAVTHDMAAVTRLAALRHPHLLPLLGSCPDDKSLLVYDLAQRATTATTTTTLVDRMLHQQRPRAGAGAALSPAAAPAPAPASVLGWRDRVRIGAEVASAVAFLHAQAPPVFCRVPLDAGRVVMDGSGAARLGFVGTAAVAAGGCGETSVATAAEGEENDTRALGVLLLRLLTGDATGDAAALVARVRGAQQADVAGGGGGRALAALAFDAAAASGAAASSSSGDGASDVWPAAEALAFADVALRCCGCGGVSAGGAAASNGTAGVPGLRSAVLPHLLQLSNRTRLYDPHQQQQAPTPSAAALDYPPAEVKGAAAADADAEEEQEEEEQDAPPPLFVCPITQDLMEDPVVAADGFTYERAAIAEWMSRGAVGGRTPRSPLTNLPFEHRTVLPNRAVKSQINSWREEQAAKAKAAQQRRRGTERPQEDRGQ